MQIELLVGMIGSGKSTYARRRAKQGALIISHDDLTEMLHGEYRYEAELKPAYLAMMRGIAVQAVLAKRDVVIDRTHLTRESRHFWTGCGYLWDVPVVAVTFPILAPEAHAQRRFEADPRGRSYEDWLKVAWHHAEQAWKEPLDGPGEGFARVLLPDGKEK